MTYWELPKEPWESEDNWDGAFWMTERGRKERLENAYNLESQERSI